MPTIEELRAKVGDQVTLPIPKPEGKGVIGFHTATIVGITPTRTC